MTTRIFSAFACVPALLLALAVSQGCTTESTSVGGDGDSGISTSDSGTSTTDSGGGDGGVTVGGTGCGFGEPNGTRETAKAITLGAAYTALCISADDEMDFYEFTAPVDAAGGFVRVNLDAVGDGQVNATLFAASDNGEIENEYATTRGASVDLFASVAPGQKYRIQVEDFAGFRSEYKYNLSVTYTKFNDTFEPNDRREDAKLITKGTPIEAFVATGHKAANIDDAEYDDWFAIDLTATTVSIKLENVPSTVNAEWEIYSPTSASLEYEYGTNKGASVIKDVAIPQAGRHFVRVSYFSPEPVASGSGTIPEHFTKPYKLTVSQ